MADTNTMKRYLAAAAFVLAVVASACGGDDQAASTPTPASTGYQSGILKPLNKTQDVVNQLNQQQSNTEQQTGSGTP